MSADGALLGSARTARVKGRRDGERNDQDFPYVCGVVLPAMDTNVPRRFERLAAMAPRLEPMVSFI